MRNCDKEIIRILDMKVCSPVESVFKISSTPALVWNVMKECDGFKNSRSENSRLVSFHIS